MRLATLISVCLVLFVQSVSSQGSDDILVSRLSVRRQSRQNYQYNHPPAFETSQPIPVAIVYDEETLREGKVLEETTYDNRLPTAPTEEKTKVSGRRRVVRKKIVKKPVESEQQIPVVVVYDEKPDVTEENYSKARGQSQRNRQRQTTEKPVSTNKERKTPAPRRERTTKGEQSKRTERPIAPIIESEKLISRNKEQKISAPQKERKTKGESRRRERPIVPIIGSENHVYAHTGEFMYSYEGGDGTRAFENGILKSYQDEKSGEAVNGGFSYTDKDGNDFSLSYTADENGYRPVGEHLPTPPPIPPAIARALAYLATKPTPETVTESFSSSKKRRN